MRFNPVARQEVVLLNEKFVVQPRPGIEHMAHASEGSRATVYRLHDSRKRPWALKAFKTQYRTPQLLESAGRLKPLVGLEGLHAAERQVVPPTDPSAAKFSDLSYAVLMPWIQGRTWFDVLSLAGNSQLQLSQETMLEIAERFLGVVRSLESRGYAHTDISQGNLVIELDRHPATVELLDLEDLYLPGSVAGNDCGIGTRGYRHRSSERGATVWCPEGDRYASAVMAAEILTLAEPALASHATSEGYFIESYGTEMGARRFDTAFPWLRRLAPQFADLFAEAWRSESLAECPTISDLYRALTARRSKPVVVNPPGPKPDVSDQFSWDPPAPRVSRPSQPVAVVAAGDPAAGMWSHSKPAKVAHVAPSPPSPTRMAVRAILIVLAVAAAIALLSQIQ